MSTHELNAVARDLMAVRSMIAELEAEAESLTDRFKADHGDLYSQYSQPTTSTRFVLSV